MLLSVYGDKFKNLIICGSPMVTAGVAAIVGSSESGETISSFFGNHGFHLASSICADSMFLVGFTIATIGALSIFFGIMGSIFSFRK